MLRHYIKMAMRHLLKNKIQNLISIVGLSVGILCFSICLYCSRFISEVDSCFSNKELIADINLCTTRGDLYSGIPATTIEELRKLRFDEVQDFTFTVYPRERSYNVEIKEGKELPYDHLMTMEVDSLFRKVFTPRILQGSWEVASNTPNAIILTRSSAKRIFGESENPIGKRMILTQRLNGRNNMTGGFGFALLRPGKTARKLEARFRSINMKHHIYDEETAITASPFGKKFWDKSIAPYFAGITMIVGLLILLTGLLNFFHFLMGTFLNRNREYGIRKVMGSGNQQLFYQLFVQSVIIAFIAFLFTFCLIEIISLYLNFNLFNYVLIIEKNLLFIQTAEYMVFILFLCMILCFITVLRIHYTPIQTEIHGSEIKRHKHGMRNILLGIQFFICWVFVAFTVALYMQAEKTESTLFNTLTEKEKANILSFSIDYMFMKNEEKLALIERISKFSGVQDKLLADISYLKGISGTGMQMEKGNPESSFEVNVMNVSTNFFQFMNIPLLSGHTLKAKEDLVVDKTWAERQKKDLLGTILYNYSESYTICGVCDDFIADVYNQSPGFVFLPSDFNYYVGHCYLKCEPGETADIKKMIEKTLKETLPESIHPHVTTLQEDIYEAQAIENKLKGIILFFSIVSLLITLLGVYSTITLDTERRQKEVAIRKVNGAGLKQIILLFARLYIKLLTVSAIIAFPLIYIVIQMWKKAYIVFFNDGIIYWAGIFIGITFITALTVLFRILRIAQINPAEVIKNE